VKNKSLVIWGDGAVGTGLAVTLSSFYETTLIGPPGSGRGIISAEVCGALTGIGSFRKAESDDGHIADHCLVAVKAYHLQSVSGPAMKSTVDRCICLCNGMGLEEQWGAGEWAERVEPAILTLGFLLSRANLVEVSPGSIIVQEGGTGEKVFGIGRLPLQSTPDIQIVRWAKWLVNSIINPLGAITGLCNRDLADAGLRPTIGRLARELAQILPYEYRADARSLSDLMLSELLEESANRSSMLQDISNGRETEIDYLTGLAGMRIPGACPSAETLTELVRAISSLSCDC
jgi:2-dehydropantoate 2-reductase